MYKITQGSDGWIKTITIDCDGDITTYTDEMEPKDATFSRDLSWIVSELERAYEQGCEDGVKDGYDQGYDAGSLVFDDD